MSLRVAWRREAPTGSAGLPRRPTKRSARAYYCCRQSRANQRILRRNGMGSREGGGGMDTFNVYGKPGHNISGRRLNFANILRSQRLGEHIHPAKLPRERANFPANKRLFELKPFLLHPTVTDCFSAMKTREKIVQSVGIYIYVYVIRPLVRGECCARHEERTNN